MVLAERPVIRTEIRGAMVKLWQGASGEVIISGPAGTGKTRGILDWIHQYCARERISVLLLRKTQESLKSSALMTYKEQVLHDFDGKRSAADGVSYFGGNDIRPPEFTYEETGSTIAIGGMDMVSKVLSTERDVIYVNEATELTEAEWEQLAGRLDRPTIDNSRPPSLLLGDCNPSFPTHWIKRRASEGKLQLWPTTHKDNPAMWDRFLKKWTKAGLAYLERLQAYTGVRRLRFLNGTWAAAEGQVYDVWDEKIHLVEWADIQDRLSSAWFIGAADWGWTKPGVLHVWAVDHDGRMILVAELYYTRRPIEGWWVPQAIELTRRFNIRIWVCDPAEPQNIALFQDAGLNAIAANNAIMPGVVAVQNRMITEGDGLPRLQMVRGALIERDEALVNSEVKSPWSTEQEILEYVWPKDTNGNITKDRPVDENNHGMDTMRYAVAHVDLRGRTGTLRPAGPEVRKHFKGLPRSR